MVSGEGYCRRVQQRRNQKRIKELIENRDKIVVLSNKKKIKI
jgi:hypothetical protein